MDNTSHNAESHPKKYDVAFIDIAMGTPGHKPSEIKELEDDRRRVNLAEDAETQQENSPQETATETEGAIPEITVLTQLPNFTTLINYFIEPNIIPQTSSTTTESFTQQQETFPQPGLSGLQTPKTKVNLKVSIKRVKKLEKQSKKQYICAVCKTAFQNSNKLNKHQQIHCSSSPFKCEHCKKSFSSKFKLVRHVLIHSDCKPFSCLVCERTFHRKDHLKNHVKVHSPCKKLYVCEKPSCKKEYTSSLSYKKHLALHAVEEGVLECQICFKTFKNEEEILYHLKVHAGSRTVKNPDEKKYSCDYCHRKFFMRKDVKRHLVVHTGKRDFLCQYCPQRFGRKDHLVRHIKKSHSNNSKSDAGIIKSKSGEIKSEVEDESNLSSAPDLDLDSLLSESFPLLSSSSEHFATSQDELTDLSSEVLNEIVNEASSDVISTEIFEGSLINESSLIDLLQGSEENLPMPTFSQIFQTPPQPPPK